MENRDCDVVEAVNRPKSVEHKNSEITPMGDPIVIVIAREEVESQDISRALSMLKAPLSTPETAKEHFEKIDIAFHGYDDDTRELFEIPEVRTFVFKLDEAFPYWFYFLSKNDLGLQALVLCFMPPYLTEDAKAQIFSRENATSFTGTLVSRNESCL